MKRGPGRPRGATKEGLATRQKLYRTALKLIASRGYEATTLRDIAKRAGVSVGLLYRYFPSKRAVVLALYDELSAEYSECAARMPPGSWGDRFLFALRTSLAVLGPHRSTLVALVPILVGDPEEGLFAPSTTFSRLRVQNVFTGAVMGANDAPRTELASALGRLLSLVHLVVLLGWMLDRSPTQRATTLLLRVLEQFLPQAALALTFPVAGSLVKTLDEWMQRALLPSGAQ